MKHRLVKSTNVYSIAPAAGKRGVRFKCAKCDGEGCDVCGSIGHGPTYEYEGVDAATFAKVSESASVGSAFHLLIKDEFKATKLP